MELTVPEQVQAISNQLRTTIVGLLLERAAIVTELAKAMALVHEFDRLPREGDTAYGYSSSVSTRSQNIRCCLTLRSDVTADIQIVIERGKKKAVAYAPSWPGWSRGASSIEAAIERLASYADRYRGVADLAGLSDEFPSTPVFDIVEEVPGRGMTDFWGISFVASTGEQGHMSESEWERKLALLQACWTYLDRVAAKVSAELMKGPRGGGRDRDQVLNHIFGNERDWARMVGVERTDAAVLTKKGLVRHREAYVRALREYNAVGKSPRTWRLQFLLRHTAYHVMDHAWEMEDKDLTSTSPSTTRAVRPTGSSIADQTTNG